MTTTDDRPLVAMSGGDLEITEDQHSWTSAQVAGLAQLGLKGADDGDLQVFFHVVRKTGLDPFAKQVYMIYRNDPMSETGRKATIQTGIDGFRLVAQRAARRDKVAYGYEDTLYRNHSGEWVESWDDPDLNPVAVKVTVLRGKMRFPAIAHWREYVQTYKGKPNRMWTQMPAGQLAKCAEALALRKAFPLDLSGIYEPTELAAGVDVAAPDTPNPDALPVAEAAQELYERAVLNAGDGAALASVWADGRAANLLDEPIIHEGTEGKLGSLILHLRSQPKHGTESTVEVVDADVVDEPKPKLSDATLRAMAMPRDDGPVNYDAMDQPVRPIEDTPLPKAAPLPCGCDPDDAWRVGHRADCPTLTSEDA